MREQIVDGIWDAVALLGRHAGQPVPVCLDMAPDDLSAMVRAVTRWIEREHSDVGQTRGRSR
jgi:hypothetical protein